MDKIAWPWKGWVSSEGPEAIMTQGLRVYIFLVVTQPSIFTVKIFFKRYLEVGCGPSCSLCSMLLSLQAGLREGWGSLNFLSHSLILHIYELPCLRQNILLVVQVMNMTYRLLHGPVSLETLVHHCACVRCVWENVLVAFHMTARLR